MKTKPKVLIIEDDKFIVKAMNLKFKDSGFDTKTAYTAESGLQILHLHKWLPDIIILDIVLPGIDGYQFIKQAKANPLWKNIPIIVASNLDPREEPQTGAAEYIVKSDLDLDTLIKKALKNISS